MCVCDKCVYVKSACVMDVHVCAGVMGVRTFRSLGNKYVMNARVCDGCACTMGVCERDGCVRE